MGARDFRADFRTHTRANVMIATGGTWTDERVEQLKSCLDAGFSCSQIAREIGVTRNAVIGKIARLKLVRVKDALAGQRERRPPPIAPHPRIVTQHQILKALRAMPERAAAEPASGGANRCSLFELGQGKCRWPINEPGAENFCFCGDKPVEGLPYCVPHARMAYSPGRARGMR
jgi:GcrA cell cycle regulator